MTRRHTRRRKMDRRRLKKGGKIVYFKAGCRMKKEKVISRKEEKETRFLLSGLSFHQTGTR